MWDENPKYGGQRPIALLAERHFGHAARDELLNTGLSRKAIDYRVRTGRLIIVYRGVYAVDYRRKEPIAIAAAAVLAGGPDAVLSHFSAAALWGLTKRWPDPPEITIVSGDRRPKGIRVHRSTTLTRQDIRHHRGIRTTSPARTTLDIAPNLNKSNLARAVNDGRLSGHLHLNALNDVIQHNPTHRGSALLAPFVADSSSHPTRSSFEDDFLQFAQTHGLPTPRTNVHVGGYEVDILFEAERVIVELDGWHHHRSRESFERDRERDAHSLLAGYITVRITWARIHSDPEREAARLNAILQSRR